jgi:DNA-binding helix-hairpin-helix protein with protein kinase domain
MRLRLFLSMELLELPGQPFEEGREGSVFVVFVRGWGKCAFKWFREPNRHLSEKLYFLLEHPPACVRGGESHLAWPLDVALNEAMVVVGYIMPFASGTSLEEFYGHRSLHLRLRLALNTVRVIESIHESGYIIGDLRSENIIGRSDGTITIVDCDSFQVGEFPCWLGEPEFLAPELLAVEDLSRVRRVLAHDRWSLATIVFLLVMQCHPFRAIYTGTDGATLGLTEKVLSGQWPYARNAGYYVPPPDSPPFDALPCDMQSMFRRAFELGHASPSQRPSASDWKGALLAFDRQLTNQVAPTRRTPPRPLQTATAPARASTDVVRAGPVPRSAPGAAPHWARIQDLFERVRTRLTALWLWCAVQASAVWKESALRLRRLPWARVGWRRWLSWEWIAVGLIVALLLLWWWIRPGAERDPSRAKPDGKTPPAFFQQR